MAQYTNLNDLFTAIANAIRAKKDTTDKIAVSDFPTEIESLRSGIDYRNQGIATIPDYAFHGCEDLDSVSCYNLTSVGKGAFENCKNLKSVILYGDVESVGENAFKGCNENLIIQCMFDSQPETWHENWNPDNREVIWLGGPIETWDISATEEDNVTARIYRDVGEDERYLLSITGNGMMSGITYHARPWAEYRESIRNVNVVNGVANMCNHLFDGHDDMETIYIPKSVGTIGFRALCGSGVVDVVIPDGITYIDNELFAYCRSLKSVTIPDSVTKICGDAFYTCSSLVDINIPDSVTSIFPYAFSLCTSLTSATTPYVGENMFSECSKLESVIISDNFTSDTIDFGAFSNCTSLASITIPYGITTIDGMAFVNCYGLISIDIPSSVTTIGANAFDCAGLRSIVIPDSVTSIGKHAFQCTYLTSVVLPDSIAMIDDYTFYNCSHLVNVTIPDSVVSIGYSAFGYCRNLTSITYTGTVEQWTAMSFASWDQNTGNYTIHCTDGDIAKDGTITYHAT